MRWRGVSRLGFEPRTLGLKVRCSDQTELPARLRLVLAAERRKQPGTILSRAGPGEYVIDRPRLPF